MLTSPWTVRLCRQTEGEEERLGGLVVGGSDDNSWRWWGSALSHISADGGGATEARCDPSERNSSLQCDGGSYSHLIFLFLSDLPPFLPPPFFSFRSLNFQNIPSAPFLPFFQPPTSPYLCFSSFLSSFSQFFLPPSLPLRPPNRT